ncbi:MazG family protein [Timonella sp. A28]|uniref:MazG family protein n=1 Tax=Timonella sp. A28 TaxID=3442640 RepID=UPI003EBBE15C
MNADKNTLNSESFSSLPGVTHAVAVMDTLRSPGGCPWDAEQTHRTLVKYLLEETHELVEAIEDDDRINMREELGDVLLQVLFHSRIAQEHPTDPFSFDDVAQDLAHKLEFRHPHVFGDVVAQDADEVAQNWAEAKQKEKGRESVFDGIPRGLGALARGQKIVSRASRDELIVNALEVASENVDNRSDAEKIGFELWDVVRRSARLGVDAEGALRQILTEIEGNARCAESEAANT